MDLHGRLLGEEILRLAAEGTSQRQIAASVRSSRNKVNEVLMRSEKLQGYSLLLNYVDEYKQQGSDLKTAVDRAVNRCIEEGILQDFLRKHAVEAQAAQETTAPSVETKKMHIAVETVEISLADLAAQDYTVPVHVYLEQNAGVTYSEWGLKMDERCTFAVQSPADEPLALTVYHAENAEQHFIWTAWASGTQIISSTGPILVVDVTLPKDAAAGDKYTVDYADWSLADKGHVWSNDADDWPIRLASKPNSGGIRQVPT